MLSNYGCFVAQYELFDNGSHARQSCHLSRAVGTGGQGVGVIPPPQFWEEQKQNIFLQKARDYYKPPGPLDFQKLPTALLRMGGPPPRRAPPVGGGGGGDQQRFDGYSSP